MSLNYVKDGQISSFEKDYANSSGKAYANFFLDKDKTIQNRQRLFLKERNTLDSPPGAGAAWETEYDEPSEPYRCVTNCKGPHTISAANTGSTKDLINLLSL